MSFAPLRPRGRLSWMRGVALLGSGKIAVALITCLVGWLAGAVAQAPVGESRLDADSVERVAVALEELILDGVRLGGGDLEHVHADWVFVFSTGHFPGEPIRAQAARETALELLRRLAVPGDTVSAFAFEMEVWPHPGAASNPIELVADGPRALESVARMFPLTAQSGSVGGHDTERALVDIAERVGESDGPIVVVFTNRAASITTDPATRPLIGEDAAPYQALLSTWRRAPAVNRSGASYEAVYDVTRWTGEQVINTLDVVLLTPAAFMARATSAPRSELRASFFTVPPVVEPPPEAPAGNGRIGWLLAVLAVAALAGALLYLLRSGRLRLGGTTRVVSVQGATLGLADVREGTVVCRLVPRGYEDAGTNPDRGAIVVHDGVPFGEEPLGRLLWHRGGLVWKDAGFQATRWNDRAVRSPVTLGMSGGVLELEASVRERPGMPPRTMRVRVDIEMGGAA